MARFAPPDAKKILSRIAGIYRTNRVVPVPYQFEMNLRQGAPQSLN
jgi:hypothetical protein